MPRLVSVMAVLFGVLAGILAGGIGVVSAADKAPTAAALPAALPGIGVIDARFGVHPDKTRFVLELTRDVAFQVSTESDPYRVHIDLPDLTWPGGSGPMPGKGLVARYRVGSAKPGVLRLTLETDGPVAVKSAFRIPPQEGHLPRLVVDLQKVAAEAFGRTSVKAQVERSEPAAPPPPPAAAALLSPPRPAKPAAQPAALPPPLPTPTRSPVKPMIVIDPGHGGADPGALAANGAFEKDITLAIARELRRQLEASGRYRVTLTRDRDVFLPLRDRVSVARDAEADLFLSLHADSIGSRSISGLSIYTLSDKASDREAEMLAAKENRADAIAGVNLATENQEVASILISLAQRDTMNQSNRFAGLALRELGREVNLLPARPHRQAGFAVLTAPDVPSVLIELGYLSNAQDLDHLTNASYRERLARGALRSIDAYFNWLADTRKS